MSDFKIKDFNCSGYNKAFRCAKMAAEFINKNLSKAKLNDINVSSYETESAVNEDPDHGTIENSKSEVTAAILVKGRQANKSKTKTIAFPNKCENPANARNPSETAANCARKIAEEIPKFVDQFLKDYNCKDIPIKSQATWQSTLVTTQAVLMICSGTPKDAAKRGRNVMR